MNSEDEGGGGASGSGWKSAAPINSASGAHQLFRDVEAYYENIESNAVPKAHEDLKSLRKFMQGEKDVFLSDRRVNLIFKDKVLLKAAMRARKKRRRGVEEEERDEEPLPDFERPEGWEASRAFPPPQTPTVSSLNRRFKWTKSDYDQIKERAESHLAYLRRLKFKTWEKLDRGERMKIEEYVRVTEQWVQRIESHVDLNEFIFKALGLLKEIDELSKEVADEVEATHSLCRVARVDRSAVERVTRPAQLSLDAAALPDDSSSLAVATTTSSAGALTTNSSAYSSSWVPSAVSGNVPLKRTATIDVQVNAMRSEAHGQLAILFRDMSNLCDYYVSLYGNVRGSGDVVDKPNVPVASVPPAMEHENQVDPWVTSGLMCPDCGVMRIVDAREAVASCPQCGSSIQYQENNLRACNFGDEPEIKRTRRRNYKPESYASQWLRKVSGKLGVEVPEEVVTMLFADFHSRRLEKVTPKIVKDTLKRHKLNEYYKCVPYLTYKFNEIPLADFSEEEQQILERMFDEYREAFHKCPKEVKKRSNLMSYAYFFYKAVEIRGWKHYMKCFPLLEGDEHIRQHDRTWRWICENKGGEVWPFIPTSRV